MQALSAPYNHFTLSDDSMLLYSSVSWSSQMKTAFRAQLQLMTDLFVAISDIGRTPKSPEAGLDVILGGAVNEGVGSDIALTPVGNGSVISMQTTSDEPFSSPPDTFCSSLSFMLDEKSDSSGPFGPPASGSKGIVLSTAHILSAPSEWRGERVKTPLAGTQPSLSPLRVSDRTRPSTLLGLHTAVPIARGSTITGYGGYFRSEADLKGDSLAGSHVLHVPLSMLHLDGKPLSRLFHGGGIVDSRERVRIVPRGIQAAVDQLIFGCGFMANGSTPHNRANCRIKFCQINDCSPAAYAFLVAKKPIAAGEELILDYHWKKPDLLRTLVLYNPRLGRLPVILLTAELHCVVGQVHTEEKTTPLSPPSPTESISLLNKMTLKRPFDAMEPQSVSNTIRCICIMLIGLNFANCCCHRSLRRLIQSTPRKRLAVLFACRLQNGVGKNAETTALSRCLSPPYRPRNWKTKARNGEREGGRLLLRSYG